MSTHVATIAWQREGAAFTGAQYSRSHRWSFDGGAEVAASASPALVKAPWSDPAGVDPEEAFVASISSCHLLWFLSLACERGFVVEQYRDQAEGVLGKDGSGRLAITTVTLRPQVEFGGERRPSIADIHELHHAAHERCFLANSLKSEVRCEPVV
ncbi:MAG: OsmC family protein [Deltaproteobacteria bacterium]|nr:OsmC family protein [Deltaproteobacteria bacterium]